MPARVLDYDATGIPAAYDRARDHGREVLDLWMRAVRRATRGLTPVRRSVDPLPVTEPIDYFVFG